jgi:protein-S-isoprenylcysteine O-methyltransferase Ste14
MARFLITATTLAVILAFTWAIRWHFRRSKMALGMWAISVISLLTLVTALHSLSVQPLLGWTAAALAIALQLAAMGLFGWAIVVTRKQRLALAFSGDASAALVTTGPYRLLAHPFYLAYALYWTSLIVATLSWLVLAGALALIALYVAAARAEETTIARSPLGEEYAEYRRGRFARARPISARQT